ncbi:TRAP transporter large permease [Catenovulum sp. 2E275]|uniref:TRAP transporter large permease n=1 Tax=Catenovulum sp. 2E275 TaxID=2980497 RepID=UPI0021D0C067|nr:TRAP transporter large permease [Catenovulum sp. 2E275]MCU4677409.1 TRAP transporter large permease [Catenovulum sp. 2E275]
MLFSFFSGLAALLSIGVPIFVALILAVFIGFEIQGSTSPMLVIQRMFSGIDSFPLMAIPLFIFAGNIMTQGGLSERILNLAKLLVGTMRGGLSMTAVSGSMFFGAISGSSPATVVSMGKLLLPSMQKEGYSKSFSVGLLMASGALGIIIPPSIFMIVYGAIAGVSIGALFMAGIGAGLVYGGVLLAYCYYRACKENLPSQPLPPAKEIFAAFKKASWGLAIPVIILGGIYGGIFTPTESAAIAVIYAAIVGLFIYKEISLKDLWHQAIDSAIVATQVMIILAAASAFSWFLTTAGLSQQIAQSLQLISDNPIMLLLVINILILVAGMFLDPNSIIIIIVPILIGIAQAAGIDPIHLGVILCVNAAIGMFTPPFGMNLFVASSLDKVSYADAIKGSLPLVALALIALVIVNAFPAISLWLPSVLL